MLTMVNTTIHTVNSTLGWGWAAPVLTQTDWGTWVAAPSVWGATQWETNTGSNYTGKWTQVFDGGTAATVRVNYSGVTFSADGYGRVTYTMGGYGTINGVANWMDFCPESLPPSLSERLKKVIEERMAPRILRGVAPLALNIDAREMRARDTLRRVIGDDKFRIFLKKGFISVRQPKSGLVYQIFPGHGVTKVYDKGKLVERLCVVLTGDFPPTDSLIMRYLLILNNEEMFRNKAIKHSVATTLPKAPVPPKSLLEIFRTLKKVAA